jgi:hypothetical protein
MIISPISLLNISCLLDYNVTLTGYQINIYATSEIPRMTFCAVVTKMLTTNIITVSIGVASISGPVLKSHDLYKASKYGALLSKRKWP